MTQICLPRLLDANLQALRQLRPVSLSVTENLAPLSMAEMEIPGEALALRDLVELHTQRGFAGVWRVTGLRDRPFGLQQVTLTHGLCTLTDGMIPGEGERTGSLRQLLTEILAHQENEPRWQLGTVDVPEGRELTWKHADSNCLTNLTELMAELPGYRIACDQTTRPWTLHILALDDTPVCQCRLNRNALDYTITWDDSEMCNRLHAPGIDEPIEDAASIAHWGVIARPLQVDTAMGEELIRKAAQEQLDKHSQPLPVITVSALDLSRETGQPIDHFTEGAVCRLTLDDGRVFEQRIVSVKSEDVFSVPEDVTLTLCSTASDAATSIASLVVDTQVIRKWVEQIDKNLRIEADTIDMIAQEIRLLATVSQVDGIATRLKQVEIDLDAAEAALTLKASATDMADVILRLSALDSEISLKADRIDLDGFLTVEDSAYIAGMLAGNDIACNALTANSSVWTEYISAYDTSTTSLSTDHLTFAGSDVGWKGGTVLTGIGVISQEKRYLDIMLADGTTTQLDIVTNVSITPSTAYITYLGGST